MSICKPRKNLAALLCLLFPPPLPGSPPPLSKRLAAPGCRRTSLKEQQLAAVFIVKTRVVPLSALPPEFHLSSLLTRLPLCLPLPPPPLPSSPLTTAQDESASMCPCSSSLSGAPRWSSSSLSNWAPTAGWNYSSPPKLSPLFLNKCGCSNRGVLLIHLYRAVWGARGACRTRQRGSNKPRSQCTTQSA